MKGTSLLWAVATALLGTVILTSRTATASPATTIQMPGYRPGSAGQGPNLPPLCEYRLAVSSCTGCSYGPTMDIECKSGDDFEYCTASSFNCELGGSCGDSEASSPCED